jgi:hypothetical protein
VTTPIAKSEVAAARRVESKRFFIDVKRVMARSSLHVTDGW